MSQKNLILKGDRVNFPIVEKGIGEHFLEQAEKLGDKIFQIDGVTDKKETYTEVKRRSTRVALYLQNIGIQPNDIVLLCCKNNLDNIIPALAAFYVGAIVASLDPKQTASEAKYAIEMLEPKVVVVEEHSLGKIEKAVQDSKKNIPVVVIGDTPCKYPNMWDIEKNSNGEETFKPMKQNGSEIALIMFSSGTTGTPKGIKITHWNALNSVPRIVQCKHMKYDVVLHLSPLNWITAWTCTMACIIYGSAKVVMPVFDAENFLRVVEQHKVTYIIGAAAYTYDLTSLDKSSVEKYDTSSLFSMCLGGSAVNPNQILRVRKVLPHTFVNMGYGSTEGNFLTVFPYGTEEDIKAAGKKVAASGKVAPGGQMKFVDPDTGKLVGPNQKGQIRTKSNYLCAGYHKFSNPDFYDEDGFFKLGDIGYYDEDGYVYVTDRTSEMFKYRNAHISPTLLEQAIMEHPDVGEAIVFGIPHEVDTNHPAACVVLNPGATATPGEISDFVNARVSEISQLREGVLVVESIMKTPTGKYLRSAMRDYFIKIKMDQSRGENM